MMNAENAAWLVAGVALGIAMAGAIVVTILGTA